MLFFYFFGGLKNEKLMVLVVLGVIQGVNRGKNLHQGYFESLLYRTASLPNFYTFTPESPTRDIYTYSKGR